MQQLDHDSVSAHIAAPPETIYELVADVTRTPEFSPEIIECRWLDGATGPAVGARFKARNKMPNRPAFANKPVVTVVEPGKTFAFARTEPFGGTVEWRYDFAPDGRAPSSPSRTPSPNPSRASAGSSSERSSRARTAKPISIAAWSRRSNGFVRPPNGSRARRTDPSATPSRHHRRHASRHRPPLRLGRRRNRFRRSRGHRPSPDRADRTRPARGADPPRRGAARHAPSGGSPRRRCARGVGEQRACIGDAGGFDGARRARRRPAPTDCLDFGSVLAGRLSRGRCRPTPHAVREPRRLDHVLQGAGRGRARPRLEHPRLRREARRGGSGPPSRRVPTRSFTVRVRPWVHRGPRITGRRSRRRSSPADRPKIATSDSSFAVTKPIMSSQGNLADTAGCPDEGDVKCFDQSAPSTWPSPSSRR